MLWSIGRLALFAAFAVVSLPLVMASYLVIGFGQGFGKLSWRSGHLHLASPGDTYLCMGVHMLLTGIRGPIMPSLGMWLYGEIGIRLVWPSVCRTGSRRRGSG